MTSHLRCNLITLISIGTLNKCILTNDVQYEKQKCVIRNLFETKMKFCKFRMWFAIYKKCNDDSTMITIAII